jgi:hypothetical protein
VRLWNDDTLVLAQLSIKYRSMTTNKIDGRKMRWFDCDWNGKLGCNECGVCRVCKYKNFREWAESVAPSGSIIGRNKEIEDYLKAKSRL